MYVFEMAMAIILLPEWSNRALRTSIHRSDLQISRHRLLRPGMLVALTLSLSPEALTSLSAFREYVIGILTRKANVSSLNKAKAKHSLNRE